MNRQFQLHKNFFRLVGLLVCVTMVAPSVCWAHDPDLPDRAKVRIHRESSDLPELEGRIVHADATELIVRVDGQPQSILLQRDTIDRIQVANGKVARDGGSGAALLMAGTFGILSARALMASKKDSGGEFNLDGIEIILTLPLALIGLAWLVSSSGKDTTKWRDVPLRPELSYNRSQNEWNTGISVNF